jgi:hypothetical protein
MTYMQNTHRFKGFKLPFADWFKFSVIEKLTYEIDEKFLTNDALDLMKLRRIIGAEVQITCIKKFMHTNVYSMQESNPRPLHYRPLRRSVSKLKMNK